MIRWPVAIAQAAGTDSRMPSGRQVVRGEPGAPQGPAGWAYDSVYRCPEACVEQLSCSSGGAIVPGRVQPTTRRR